ncbi:MAG: hypothetical protein AB1405_01060 [Bdellovibrionota bacterium]
MGRADFSANRVLKALREELRALYGEHLVWLVLFSPHVDAKEKPGDPLEVLAVLRGESGVAEEPEKIRGLLERLSRTFGEEILCRFATEKDYVLKKDPFLEGVRRDGVLL